MSDAEDNSGDTPKTRQGTKYARKEFVHDQRELVRKNLGEQFDDESDLGSLLSEDIETVEMTKDESDDDSNDKTDNGNGQPGSGETQTQKVDSTLKEEITSQIESSVKSLGDSLLAQLKDTFAEQFRAALAEKSLPNIENQTSGIVRIQSNVPPSDQNVPQSSDQNVTQNSQGNLPQSVPPDTFHVTAGDHSYARKNASVPSTNNSSNVTTKPRVRKKLTFNLKDECKKCTKHLEICKCAEKWNEIDLKALKLDKYESILNEIENVCKKLASKRFRCKVLS
ncbi:hypothetical protein QAD02_020275 [Eretmocerus hayati]|uniref:Uncharacterized protein n=1 Tax=Eretmocerus hayati TaxID=131215 RepID=A0ACC2PN02_9HYME|nr:hypothetical protein QAD02_020275 [Eretmocerus hayati]